MSSKMKNPASAVQGASTGSNILSLAARDSGFNTKSPASLQADFVARRCRLQPTTAGLIASLAFGGAA